MAGDSEKKQQSKDGAGRQPPAIEWVAGGAGLVMAVVLLGFLGWKGVTGTEAKPPEIELSIEEVTAVAGGYVAKIRAHNRAHQTAASVEVEGVLKVEGGQAEKSSITFDYVPGGSDARGGLFFTSDPRGRLELRALGYSAP